MTVAGTSKRFVLLALADRASDRGERTSLGVPTLCRKTDIKRSTMYGLLRELEEDDLIQRDNRRGVRRRRALRIWINLHSW
ncbi:DNA-binding IclR family transcriptional regulator [Kutzneria viridogrisea]|uniref:DNA-binding IclR family transcriptional regulator n=1 Tax=Kutzneria viridogrisea TaxID=47990 RepID=A0ABR6BCC4_9PSEU|nr:DNA-binding IclR family transcriptional regulator [Kutzneria viridogrisea]